MYRTYRGIIIISDYNSCNISYTIVDKYFLSLLLYLLSSSNLPPMLCYVSVCPISIKFHFMLILSYTYMFIYIWNIEGYFIVIPLSHPFTYFISLLFSSSILTSTLFILFIHTHTKHPSNKAAHTSVESLFMR